ncbi:MULTISPECIES: UDP-N-acetylmuramoyl-tripeptide--D-alanyl-D-alanine ligase [Francisella]|uniref:UDP-N-acetylmuramoyl-tripeptide--D-alanyl-D-alanine ligase n=1 Tax=Francisella opportunistica TaxID=2016517 RepID=A0A345JSE4_9GAMM|nr:MULTISPECIES: UDP-N-acetylmuramoyl-tripeptide--D-alanyl-D-alanine ligase [Francisella]APC92005.1 UDP-N-acetylmuramoylalanyl-D-glutamyl-2,6- diaminopimelate--D-alanyl-D-alanine ligase [Francisella sp. MA067296]AXH30240.1 UDP-N-acetylmuramoyl-tripeptide--D-alanyl-D-alanine ligase [Francisella opportunistica]AXH31881.1 UDP-N-acetylmuramoylalanyl-D-glutamyl-2, 6-diaminopimelate--D-alanyl-D-alanine ligase [Francisella opportunistica]AXH33527.1 UDP-N-acetylmuramoylalanyl-D-glutamyl-2, 6-diaminopim
MIKSLKQLAIQAGLEYLGEDVSIQTVAINSNEIRQDCLFVAIVANRDGHEFIPSAIANGVKAVLVSKKQDLDIPQIVCQNTIKGLRALAKEYRKSLTMPIISLTGSCGKTSVKEMIVTLLGAREVHFTQGNLNNYLGVPMTILETPHDVGFAVIEAGTNVGGEIKAAADIIQPNIAMITNVGACHLENLKTLDDIMTEKGELLKALPKNGCCIVNLDDERIPIYAKQLECKKITCSMSNPKADILVLDYQVTSKSYVVKIKIFDKEYDYQLPNIGKHNLFNSVLAIASVIAAGIQPQDFLINTQNIKNYKGRFSSEQLTDKLILVDDTYNASAAAVEAAIEDLAEFDGKKILAISSMRELGEEAENYHRKMGQWLKKANLDKIFLFGEQKLIDCVLAEYPNQNAKYYDSKDKLNNDLARVLDEYKSQNTKLTVKGARSFKMEEVVAFVKQRK